MSAQRFAAGVGVLLVAAAAAVFFGGRTLRNGPGLPGVVPSGVFGHASTLTPPHTMDFVPAFIDAALAGQPLTVHGDGLQSRDFTYVGTVSAVLTRAVIGTIGPA